ncbi:TusE/DsrC/DsvC family sulfur relay protein, partial [Anaerobiospirillum succiniciproducens]
MAVLLFDGREIETDDEGYLLNLDDYSDELRDFMASEMDLELTDEHMVIINTVREYYKEYDTT